ncbi:MAG: hypothetical protein UU40_C0026G0002 [Candidatus Uhrbacteria bacterium GW2011_GWD2_41_121]|nr:MAG: hypothetical protein US57_C0011G0006 [Candidatus Moranbacteria bacterium GW2011_GWC2_37_73]KKR89437.1 MAG: hypothetical protein UU40_C0026G0002 [Candidatus Uhrbacteria bacterium GW2011_GWD2_41_121]HBU10379.1 hypothetical protein [Candidatus Moranbacteria bacterium]
MSSKLIQVNTYHVGHNGGPGGPINMQRFMDHFKLISKFDELPKSIKLITADGTEIEIMPDESTGNLWVSIYTRP